MGGIGAWSSVVVVAALGVAGYFAYQKGAEKAALSAAEDQVKGIIVPLAQCIAEKASSGSLPPSARPLPLELADLRKHQSITTLATEAPYDCVKHSDTEPLRAQIVWIRDLRENKDSRVFARIDANLDGKPEAYLEAPVFCESKEGMTSCYTPTHAYTVLPDGQRVPPALAEAAGRMPRYGGAPPHLDDAMSPDRVETGPTMGAKAGASTKVTREVVKLPDLGPQLHGQPASYGMLVQAAQELAAKADPKLTLVGLKATSLIGDNVDPSEQTLELLFGQVDSNERLHAGADILSISYQKSGLVSETRKAPANLMAVPIPVCGAPRVFELTQAHSASLERATGQDRVLWHVVGKNKKPLLLDADKCSVVRK